MRASELLGRRLSIRAVQSGVLYPGSPAMGSGFARPVGEFSKTLAVAPR